MPDSTSNQDPQCTEIIQSILLIFWPIVIVLVAAFLIYGIYLTVTLLAVVIDPELLASTAYVVVTIVMIALLFHDNLSLEWTQHYLRLSQQVYAGTDVVMRLNFLLSDGIVVWRTWVLFPFDKLVKATLVFCMLVTSVCTCVDGGIAASRTSDIIHSVGGPVAQNLLTSLPLLITNILATALIGYKAWSHRKTIKQNLMSTGTNTSKALKTLWLLIESGLVYCIILMAYIIVIQTGPDPNDAYATFSALIFASIIPLLAALFPSLVILVAALEETKEPGHNLSPDGNNISGSLSQSIRFASENAAASAANVSMMRSGGVLEVDLQDRVITFAPSPSADAMEHPIKNNV
ncbi:hypothetical protein K435DRAFT_867139 [Dendrothele bispora CBS 962.96]|uniref:Uncharacterized protein n=1 Tax=Dendrothele bispora (strain CBS 962.96) TaxID=1314807 RepID=A0A4S8LF86_DENBC|nr:hypothetical protein K435DRAFT_867139 [Dendrothele bispora CBS 962.96]